MNKNFTDDKMLLLHTMLVLYIKYINGCTNFDVYNYIRLDVRLFIASRMSGQF